MKTKQIEGRENLRRLCYTVAKTSLPSILLWYGAIAALVTSLGAWIVYLTGELYLKLEPAEEQV